MYKRKSRVVKPSGGGNNWSQSSGRSSSAGVVERASLERDMVSMLESMEGSERKRAKVTPSEDDLDPEDIITESPQKSKPRKTTKEVLEMLSSSQDMSGSHKSQSLNLNSSLDKTFRSPPHNVSSQRHQLNLSKSMMSSQKPLSTITDSKSKSNFSSQRQKSQMSFSQRQRPLQPKNYMEEVLCKAGMILSRDDSPNLLRNDQAVFVRNVTKAFKTYKDKKELDKWTDKFIENFETYCTEKEKLKLALSPSKTDLDSNFTRGEFQDSLIRLLLSVDDLQVKLIEFLLSKIADYTSGDGGEGVEEDAITWVRMILQPMRYLNRIIDPVSTTQRLFDIIHISPNLLVHHEVINCLPDIISDQQHKGVANELIEVMRSEPSLTPSVLVALENLCLESGSVYELQVGLVKALRKASLEHLPAFIRFIISGDAPPHIDELINGLRSELTLCLPGASGLTQSKQKEADVQSVQTVIFDKLRDAVLGSRKLSEAWLKNIANVKLTSKHVPIDVIMLLIIHSTATDILRKRSVETTIRSKIKTGLFTESLIKDTFVTVMAVIKQYFKDLLKVASVLLQSPDLSVSNYGAFIFKECFMRVEGLLCKSIILELLDLVGMNSSNARAPLALLHSLTIEHTSKISPYVSLIMLVFDYITELSTVEVRLLIDLLYTVAYGDPDDTSVDMVGLQHELYMIVQKLLTTPNNSNLFRSGIVCTAMAIKHMVAVPEGDPNDTPDPEEENITLNAKATKAFTLLELVINGTKSIPEALVLTYDQLSYIIMMSDNLDKTFIRKFSLHMQNTLQTFYIITSSDFTQKNDRLEATLQYCIDTDIEDPIVLNLAEAVMREESGLTNQRCVGLPGLVRVIRSLEMADMGEIDALLGCAVALPAPTLLARFSSQDNVTQKLALDTLFHATNWFREILNCFVYMVKEGNPAKILMRLRLIAHLQSSISNFLPQAVNYKPPTYHYNSRSPTKSLSQIDKSKRGNTNKKKGRKKSEKEKGGEGDEEVGVDDASTFDSDEEKEVEVEGVELGVFQQYLRELEFDVLFLILTQPLTLTPSPIKDGVCSGEFGGSELELILEDLVGKLSHSLGAKRSFPGRSAPVVGFDHLAVVPVQVVVRNFSRLSSHLSSHLHKLVEFSHNLIKVHDSVWDAPGMFAPGTTQVKRSVSFLFKAFDVYFSWSDIKLQSNNKLLVNSVANLGGVGKGKAGSLNEAVQACVTYLSEISQCMMDLPSVVSLITLIKTVSGLYVQGEDVLTVNIEGICEAALKRRWYDLKGNEVKNSPQLSRQLTVLLELYLGTGGFNKITETLSWLTDEAEVLGNDTDLTTFPHFNKNNLNVLIQALCKGLTTATKSGIEGKDLREQLTLWDKVLTCLQELVVVVKAQDSKVNLRYFLKGCSPLLRLFLSQGINICSTMFKMESLVVPQMLKKLQVVTRYIQTVCNYSKVCKDSSMIHQLPLVRGILESILLAVKNMVLKNKCTDAFFMGSMKNKDIKGDVIISQEEEEDVRDTTEEEPTPVEEEEEEEGEGEEGVVSEDESGGVISDTC